MSGGPMGLDFSGIVVEEVGEAIDPGVVDGVRALPYYGQPGTQGTCPDCGRSLKILKSGDLWAHKCVGGEMTTPVQSPSSGGTTPPSSGGGASSTTRKGRTPKKVQVLWVALAGGTTEWSAREVVHKNTGAPKAIIPADIPDDDAAQMFEPVLDAIWPRLPKGAQKAIASIAEEAGLILAAITWADYFKGLKTFQDEYRRTVQVQQAPPRPRPVPNPPAQHRGAPDGLQGSPSTEPGPFPGYEPFAPAG